eukprot:7529655-Pyramimonas_sp.AAC.1
MEHWRDEQAAPKPTRPAFRELTRYIFSAHGSTSTASNPSEILTNHAKESSAEERSQSGGKPRREGRDRQSPVAYLYWTTKCLHYEDQIPDGFCAMDSGQEVLEFYHLENKAPSAPELGNFSLDADDNREVLVVDHARDPFVVEFGRTSTSLKSVLLYSILLDSPCSTFAWFLTTVPNGMAAGSRFTAGRHHKRRTRHYRQCCSCSGTLAP